MRNLVIMPAMANNRERMNLGEYAEEATIIMDEPVKPANHFIEANTQEVTLNHLKNDCITPVFSKDNELTINHAQFVETIQDAAQSFFCGEKVEQATIRASHIIKGRIPEAIHKPARENASISNIKKVNSFQNKFFHEILIPPCHQSFSSYRYFLFIPLKHCSDHFRYNRIVYSRVHFLFTVIFPEFHIKHPVKSIFHLPVIPLMHNQTCGIFS